MKLGYVARVGPALPLYLSFSNPLVQLERHVKQIADRDWYRPIKVERQDEISSLAASIERMRERLVQQDEAQQSFLQNVSHELKTPGGKFGLGLSIVQRIVSIYRGRVWAANENKGVAFYLELPLVLSSTG